MRKLLMIFNVFTCFISKIISKKNRWIFGAWFGERISDNTFALYNYVRKNFPDIESVWICNDPESEFVKKNNIKAVKRNSFNGILYCLTSKVAVMNQGYMDFGDLNWIEGSYKVQLWHGVPWKRIGEDMIDHKEGLFHKISHKIYLSINKYDLYIAPSDESVHTTMSAFLVDKSKILKVGQPRNELLLDEVKCQECRKKLVNIFGNHKTIILYMPTFRDNNSLKFSFNDIYNDISSVLDEYDAIIIEKQHFVDIMRKSKDKKINDRIINVSDFDAQELLAAADVLITDYSSCFFDYTLRRKPIIHYIYDYEQYKNKDRGLYYDKDYVLAGKEAYSKEQLFDAINDVLNNSKITIERSELIRNRFCSYESLDNCKNITEGIINDISQSI